MRSYAKLGIIAGAGEMPVRIAEHCRDTGAPYYVARITGFADPALHAFPGGDFGLGQMGRRMEALREAECDTVVFAGVVRRPDFASLDFDDAARQMLPVLVAAARTGDDALLSAIVAEHEARGFRVIGAEAALDALAAPDGAIGAHAPDPRALADIAKGAGVAAALGAWDVGQGCVVCDGLVLAVEAQEGTDAMLRRVSDLPPTVRGTPAQRRGVLVKRPKPQQERRIDLPTIGVSTVENAAAAGLAGVAIEARGALIVDKERVAAAADALGLFVYGFPP